MLASNFSWLSHWGPDCSFLEEDLSLKSWQKSIMNGGSIFIQELLTQQSNMNQVEKVELSSKSVISIGIIQFLICFCWCDVSSIVSPTCSLWGNTMSYLSNSMVMKLWHVIWLISLYLIVCGYNELILQWLTLYLCIQEH